MYLPLYQTLNRKKNGKAIEVEWLFTWTAWSAEEIPNTRGWHCSHRFQELSDKNLHAWFPNGTSRIVGDCVTSESRPISPFAWDYLNEINKHNRYIEARTPPQNGEARRNFKSTQSPRTAGLASAIRQRNKKKGPKKLREKLSKYGNVPRVLQTTSSFSMVTTRNFIHMSAHARPRPPALQVLLHFAVTYRFTVPPKNGENTIVPDPVKLLSCLHCVAPMFILLSFFFNYFFIPWNLFLGIQPTIAEKNRTTCPVSK